MNEQDKKVPTLRFKGFTNDWEQHKLGENTMLITKGTTPYDKSNKGPINFIKVENIKNNTISPSMHITEIENDSHLSRSKLKENDILFSIAGTLGRTAIVTSNILPANTNQALAIIRGYNFNQQFLINYLSGRAVKNFIRQNPTIGAQPNLSLKQIKSFTITAPNNDYEQIKIGSLIKKLNNLVTLQQRKLDLLKQLKKGLLQKMFADKGSKRPILRFSGFKGDLVNKRLEEISKIRGGFSFKSNSFKKQGIPIIRISNIKNDGSVVGPFVFYTPLDEDAAFTLEGESIIIAMSGATTGKIASINSKQKYYQNQRVGFFEKTSCVNYDYLKYLLDTEKLRENLRKVLIAGAQPNISGKDIDKFEFVITTDQHEQKEIAKLFGSLEDDILHQKSKVSKMKSLKKFFLQKMFI